MRERREVIDYCLTYKNVIEDYPFSDVNWCLIRHKSNKKVFAWIFNRDDNVWINVKCSENMRELWRSAYKSVIPAYHLNKEHWNSIILDGTIPDEEVAKMITESYELTAPKKKVVSREAPVV